jgi:hypothetical protein
MEIQYILGDNVETKECNMKLCSGTNRVGGERSKSCINAKLFMPQNQASIPPAWLTLNGSKSEKATGRGVVVAVVV